LLAKFEARNLHKFEVKFYAEKKRKKNQLLTASSRVAKVDAENIALRWKIAEGCLLRLDPISRKLFSFC